MNTLNKHGACFKGKKILITGNTGFKGTWLTLFLLQLEANVFGVSSENCSNDTFYKTCQVDKEITQYFEDISDFIPLKKIIDQVQPDFVFHLAAQSITSKAYKEPLQTIKINGLGTANLLECFRKYEKPCDIIIITSDKCYKNNEWVWGYRENDLIAGVDPYSASKSIAEIIFQSYYQTYFKKNGLVQLVSCRAGNVIGGGDWSKKRIIPDCMRAWKEKKAIEIRSPKAIRPWNDVLDVIYGYTLCASLIRKKNLNGESFNFGPQANKELTVLELVDGLWEKWQNHDFEPYIIYENREFDENMFLKLSVDKAEHILKWQNKTELSEMLERTTTWYWKYLHQPESIRGYSKQLIEEYLSKF